MKISVKDLKWDVEPIHGIHYPVLQFDPIEIDGNELSYLPLREMSHSKCMEMLGTCKLVRGDYEFEIPSDFGYAILSCLGCGSDLLVIEDKLCCAEWYCSSKAITSLERLTGLLNHPDRSFANLQTYLTMLPIKGGQHTNTLNVLHKEEALPLFLTLFQQAGPKNLASRQLYMEKAFGNSGKGLWTMEVQLEQFLNDGLQYWHFWYILNLDGIGWEEASNRLYHINPRELSSLMNAGENEQVSRLLSEHGASPHAKSSIILNKSYWMQVMFRLNLEHGQRYPN